MGCLLIKPQQQICQSCSTTNSKGGEQSRGAENKLPSEGFDA